MKSKIQWLVAVATLAGTCAAQAEDNVVKLGLTRYDTHARTTGIQGIGVPAGADAAVGDATTRHLTRIYLIPITPSSSTPVAQTNIAPSTEL